MSILYTTGTKNEANAAAVGQAMAEQLRDDIASHAAWELVEEFTATSGLVRWYVFKCLATESGLPSDFYAILGRTLSNGELFFTICEGYDSTTNVMTFFGLNYSSTQYLFDASGRTTRSFTLGTAQLDLNSGNPHPQSWAPSGTTAKWWLTVAEDGFTVAFNGASNGFVHLGAYIPLAADAIAMPLQIVGSSSSEGAVTRNPSVASITTYSYAHVISGGGSTTMTGEMLGFRGSLKNNDKLQGNKRVTAEQGIVTYNAISNREPIYGWALGKQKRMRCGADSSTPVGMVWGDAYAMDGTLWQPYLPSDFRIWDTGVAV